LIHLLPVGAVPIALLDGLAAFLARALHLSCHVRTDRLDPSFAFDAGRNQYWSTAILKRLQPMANAGARLLAVTDLDLFVPILTFVFGEAQVGGPCALVSTHRLGDEYYGLPPDPQLLAERLAKESLHELGHTMGLRHCADWRCVMASTHAVERLDLKQAAFCARCLRLLSSP
jgi:archaemetzincin